MSRFINAAFRFKLPKKSDFGSNIISKVIGVGLTTLASRLLGLLREVLMGNFLGTGLAADLFFTAYKIPNSLRKIFAEGALSAALVPSCVYLVRTQEKGQRQVSQLLSLSLLFFQGFLFLFCALIFWKAEAVVRFIAPGWFVSGDTILLPSTIPVIGRLFMWIAPAWYTIEPISPHILPIITYIRILIGFILCLSSSALLAAALQASNHFFIPAASPVVLNIIYCSGLGVCLYAGFDVQTLCGVIMFGGLVQLFLHLIVYFSLGFRLCLPDKETWHFFWIVLAKFVPCLLSMSVMEINLFVSTSLATYLPRGTIASIYYANRFMGIPLGVFAVAFSTILLPYFSKVGSYAPRRLGFYLFEAAKLIAWVTIPLALLLAFFADKIFLTLFLSPKFTPQHAYQAAQLLIVFSTGLFVFSLNKILLNVFYALHKNWLVTLACTMSALVNYLVSRILIGWYGAVGLAIAFVVAGFFQAAILAYLLKKRCGIVLYFRRFADSVACILGQNFFLGFLFWATFNFLCGVISIAFEPSLSRLFLDKIVFWCWALPLIGIYFVFFIVTRRFFGIKTVFFK